MKKFFIILLVIIVVLIGAVIALPIIFKDDIKLAVQNEIEKNVKAKVFFDENKIGVSILKDFPNITLTLHDFGLVGVEPFQEDTLFSAGKFGLTVDIKSVISGSNINLKRIDLDNPRIFVLVLKNGQANYDIAVDSGEPADTTTTESTGEEMKIGIQSWNITNGRIVYDDESMPMIAVIDGLDHHGSGDFTTSVFDMVTKTTIKNLFVSYDGVDYIKNKKLDADLTMNMDLNNYKFTFKDNSVKLNDFGLNFNGFFAMPKEGFDMDINFKSEESTFKSLFSLVPSAYLEGYENIKANGNFKFEGFVKGLYSDSLSKMPAFRFALNATNGSIQYPDLPEEIKNVNIDFLVDNKDGVIDNTVVDLSKFHMDFGQNPIDATLHVDNLKDYRMKASMTAKFNLGDVLKMVPMDSTEIAGMLDASLSVDGVYDSTKHVIPAQGTMSLNNFSFKSPDLPQGMTISSTKVDINTSKVVVDHFDGTIGKSDMHMKGFLSNYVDYIFSNDAVLLGQLDFRSNEFNANEWMSSDTTETETPEDTTSYELVQIPKNIDFTLNSSIGKIDYENLALNDFKGMLIVRDGVLRLDKVGFNTLGGIFGMDGTYDTRDLTNPLFDFTFNIQNLSIPKAYEAFNSVQKMAPIAKSMEGNFSTDFIMNGKLQNDYMPDYNTVQGNGVLQIADAKVKGSETKVISRIASVTKIGGDNGDITIKDTKIDFEIINGRIYTKPFNVKIANNNSLVAGSSGMDGTLDYTIKMDVPAAAVKAAASLVSSVTGQNLLAAGSNMKMNLGIKGNYDDPKVTLLGAESGGSSASAKESLTKAVEQKKEEVVEKAKTVVQEQKKVAEAKIDSVKQEQTENVKKEVDKAKQDVKGKLKGLLKKGN